MLFIGLDLAWSSKHNSAIALIEYNEGDPTGKLVDWREELGGNNEIIAYLGEVAAAKPALLAIDAPLVVPNIAGARLGDKLLSQVFRPYQAGTHPANRTNLGRYGNPPGDIRGETLSNLLTQTLNFAHDPQVQPHQLTRQFFECYPHPAMVVIFQLAKTLKYKRKLKSLNNDRHLAYAELQAKLSGLATLPHEPCLSIPPELLARNTRAIRPVKSLKHYEDLLDAIMCAYVAFYYWWWGNEKVHVFGDWANGYVVSPIFSAEPTKRLRRPEYGTTQTG
jgi:predicted RNase H-like nuclease